MYSISHRVGSSLQYGRRRRPRGLPPVRRAAAGVLLGVQEHDVHLGHEEAEEVDRRAQNHAHAQARDLNLEGRNECIEERVRAENVAAKGETMSQDAGWIWGFGDLDCLSPAE